MIQGTLETGKNKANKNQDNYSAETKSIFTLKVEFMFMFST